jgi:Protein of unknown function (DUF541)
MKKKLLFVTICCFVVMLGLSVAGYAEESQVVVSASGKVSVKPDMAEFGIVVKSDAKTAEKAAAETAEKYRTVQDALRSAGISLEDAPTSSYTVSPRWEWDQSQGKSLLKGYSARHSIMVKVRNLGKTGKAIDAVVQAGSDGAEYQLFIEQLRHAPSTGTCCCGWQCPQGCCYHGPGRWWTSWSVDRGERQSAGIWRPAIHGGNVIEGGSHAGTD